MATGDGDVAMRYSSSPELSSPPSGSISEPSSPPGWSRPANATNTELDEIVVDPRSAGYRVDEKGQPVLTKAGLPRKKSGPKPGTIKRSRDPDASSTATDATKVRKPRKPRDPDAPPPAQRRRKIAPSTALDENVQESPSVSAAEVTPAPRQPKITDTIGFGRIEQPALTQPVVKQEAVRGSMQSILNADPEPPPPRASVPARTSGTAYDPIRSSNYDPVRETMVTHNFSSSLGSPRAPTQVINRASASPSIASLVDPPVANLLSPVPSPHTSFAQANSQQSRAYPEPGSVPASPTPLRKEVQAPPSVPALKPTPTLAVEAKKPPPPPPVPAAAKIEIRPSSITTIGAGPAKKPSPKNQSTASDSPKLVASKDVTSVPGGTGRSILDFGKAEPGSELQAPSIVLSIPLQEGETNKYVNFMRLAEERYGWDALHPRLAAHRERKARIAAASAALAQTGSGRESGDEMSVDESEDENSNVEMGGTSGPDKPVKKKRHFKEDEYDKADDFVDDSEMLWEEQAAASRDGFFVYSGPLVPEVEKTEAGRGDGPPKRGRGSRGGRGGASRGTGAGRGTGSGRGGGPGSRGGVVRKPRMTKADKAQLDREKADREKLAQMTSKSGSNYNVLNPAASPPFAGLVS